MLSVKEDRSALIPDDKPSRFIDIDELSVSRCAFTCEYCSCCCYPVADHYLLINQLPMGMLPTHP